MLSDQSRASAHQPHDAGYDGPNEDGQNWQRDDVRQCLVQEMRLVEPGETFERGGHPRSEERLRAEDVRDRPILHTGRDEI